MQKFTARRTVLFTYGLLVVLPFAGTACLSEEEAAGDDEVVNLEQELTLRIEGEAQSWTTSSGDSVSLSSSNARLQANASGDSFSFSRAVTSGTYSVVVRFAKRNLYGNYRVEVNGTSV